MTPLDFIALALFAWYLSYVLIRTHGPFKIFMHVRQVTTIGGLLECQWCLIVWVAALGYTVLQSPYAGVVYAIGAAGLGMLGHRFTGGDHV